LNVSGFGTANRRSHAATQFKERDMKANVAILAAMACTQLISPAIGQTCALRETPAVEEEALQPPHVDYVSVRASLLHWGMSAADVERIMGPPAPASSVSSNRGDLRILRYADEPIAATVSITNDKVSSVLLDIAGVEDLMLPAFSRAAWLGMSRASVLQLLGIPCENRVRHAYGMTVEQLVFKSSSGSEVSIFLIDDRVVTKKVGTAFPSDVLGLVLPFPPDPPVSEVQNVSVWPKEQRVQLGMKARDLQTMFGVPKLLVDYRVKGRPAAYAIYETTPNISFGTFTLINGVLTAFADGGSTPLSEILDGR
jgi:hypothetical protein